MRKDWYKQQLENDSQITSQKAIASRISKANKVEKIIGSDLDVIVADDQRMAKAVQKIKDFGDYHGSIENALRKYYFYFNGKKFPGSR